MPNVNLMEVSLSFAPASSGSYAEEENIIVVAIGGGALLKTPLSESQRQQLCENLGEAFAFLAEDGVVDVEYKTQ